MNIFKAAWGGIEDAGKFVGKIVEHVPNVVKATDDVLEEIPKLIPDLQVIVADIGNIVVVGAADADTFLPLLLQLTEAISLAAAVKGANVVDDAHVLMCIKNIATNIHAFKNCAPLVQTLLLDGSSTLGTFEQGLKLAEQDFKGQPKPDVPTPPVEAKVVNVVAEETHVESEHVTVEPPPTEGESHEQHTEG